MGERLAPWRAKPPKAVAELIEQAASVRLYLVQRPGPTSFILSDEGQQHKHKVNVGARPSCTCRPEHAFACKELCIHVLFVMLRVLRLPPSNPLCWQLSLIDRELEEVLHWGSRLASRPETAAAPGSQTAVARRPLEEEDACAICYEAMRARPGVARDDLVHCRYGCGHNVHARCLKVWAGHQATLHQELTCPLCRTPWGPFHWAPARPRPRNPSQASGSPVTHPGTRCRGCTASPIQGSCYSCVACAHFQLCDSCFGAGSHPQHEFVHSAAPGARELPAQRSTALPLMARSLLISPLFTSDQNTGQPDQPGQPPMELFKAKRQHSAGRLLPTSLEQTASQLPQQDCHMCLAANYPDLSEQGPQRAEHAFRPEQQQRQQQRRLPGANSRRSQQPFGRSQHQSPARPLSRPPSSPSQDGASITTDSMQVRGLQSLQAGPQCTITLLPRAPSTSSHHDAIITADGMGSMGLQPLQAECQTSSCLDARPLSGSAREGTGLENTQISTACSADGVQTGLDLSIGVARPLGSSCADASALSGPAVLCENDCNTSSHSRLAKQHSTDQLREARSKPAVVATPQKQLGRSMKPAAKRQHPAKEPKLSQEPLDRLSLVGTGLGLR